MGFFNTWSRSWEFARVSYGMLRDFKQLVLFPVLAMIAWLVVLATFILPLWGFGTLSQLKGAAGSTSHVVLYVVLFLFYFASYSVIVFFNAALVACAMRVVEGEAPTLGYGLSMAAKRLPQILAWALLSAVVGVGLKALENVHEKAGRIIAAILGSSWSALTYFAVPVIVMEGVGPVDAVKRSVQTLKDTWGTALVGNFSLGIIGILLALPVILVAVVLGMVLGAAHSGLGIALLIVVTFGALMVVGAVNSAADTVFKAILYNFATGRTLPANLDRDALRAAFVSRPD